jgi:hypothetical protein
MIAKGPPIAGVQAPRINADRTITAGRPALSAASEQTQLTLLEGQCICLQLTLENIGKMDIDHITVDVQSSSNVLAKYTHDCHPLVHFTGMLINQSASKGADTLFTCIPSCAQAEEASMVALILPVFVC